jgi:AcrR family transcriptional regulator
MMVSAARTRPRRRLDAVRRPQILAATIDLIREKGLWTVRISDVAQRAGLSPTSVVYYFGTKDQLFAEAITGVDDAFYEETLDELARLERACDRVARLIVRSSTTDWLLWIDLWVYTLHHADTEVAQRKFQRRWRQTIQDVIEYGCQTGEWQVTDPAAAAQRLSALTDGLAAHMVLGNPEFARDRYVEMTLTAASLELACDVERLRRAAAACPETDDEGAA